MPVATALPTLTPASQALACTRFASWFPQYRRYTPKATVLRLDELQPDFVEWLEEDGLVLPTDSDNEKGEIRRQPGSPVHAPGSDDEDEDEDGDDESEAPARDFGALNKRIREVISEYDGGVFPKLDWSAPLDAAWIVPGGTLRCTTPADVYLLLKSSDFVTKDVTQLRELQSMAASSLPQQGDSPLPLANATSSDEGSAGRSTPPATMPRPLHAHLVLKKFFAIPTSHEFRCFVRAGHLIAISQRDVGTFFEHLQPTHEQRLIRAKLQDFFARVLWPVVSPRTSMPATSNGSRRSSSPSRFPIADFAWDAYLTRDQSRVLLVDVNPYLDRTDALLWAWPEVEAEAERQLLGTPARRNGDGRRRGSSSSASSIGSNHDDASSTGEPLPPLRLVTSRAQTTQAFPTYAHNMVPSDVIGMAQGADIATFARDFNAQLADAAGLADGERNTAEGAAADELSPGRWW